MAEGTEDLFESLFESGQTNAVLSWLLVSVYVVVLLESLLSMDLEWIVFTGTALVVLLLPALTERTPWVMLPWELVLLASFPVLVRTLDISAIANTFSMYLSIAALAVLVISELHVLSEVRVTHWFAMMTVVMATMAAAAGWAIVRWLLDSNFDTEYLTTNDALMQEFLWVVAAGIVAGLLFDLYFKRRSAALRTEYEVVE